jgi:hypothetical protein
VTGNVTINLTPTTGYSGSGGGAGGGGSTVNIVSQLGDYRNGGGGVGVYGTSGIISSGKPPGGFGSGEGSTSSIFGITNGKVDGKIKGKDYTMSAGSYGGGGSAYNYTEGTTYGSFPNTLITKSGGGVVRIVWPGDARNFPSDFVGRNSVNISANVATVNEGASVAFTITTTGYPDNFPFYWRTTDGATTVSAADFTDTINTGNFTIRNGQAVVTRSLAADFTPEGPETIVFEVATGGIREKALLGSTVIVNDTSLPLVTISANKNPSTPLNEGEAIEFTLHTQAPIANRTFYWENTGTTVLSDFDEGKNSGTITTGADGSAKILLTIKNDFTTEIVETILIRIKDTAQATGTRATSSTFSVTDTSKTLVPKYSLTADKTSVNEGEVITFTLTYENIPINTKITLSPGSSGVRLADASDYVDPGEYTFTSASPGFSATNSNRCTGSIEFRVTIGLDQKTEGVEYLTMGILDTNKRSLATSTSITINDTSTTPAPTYSIDTGRVTEINESEAVTFTITTTNLPPNTALTWTNKGTTEVPDFSSISVNGKTLGTMAMTGTVPIVSGKGTIIFLTKNDLSLEGPQNISLEIKNGTTIVIQPTTNSVKVNDTSIPIPEYKAIPNKTSVNEGETVIFSVTTKNVPSNATTIYWAATGNIQDSDVGTPKGKLNLVNGGGSISIMARKDYVTGERDESFCLEFRAASTSGDAYYTSPSVIINANDT